MSSKKQLPASGPFRINRNVRDILTATLCKSRSRVTIDVYTCICSKYFTGLIVYTVPQLERESIYGLITKCSNEIIMYIQV